MSEAFLAVLKVHVTAALLCAVVFWLPVFTVKGGTAHRRAGWAYVVLLFVVTATAVALTALSFDRPREERPAGGSMPLDHLVDDMPVYHAFQVLLVFVAVCTFAAALTGVRALKRRARAGAVEAGFHALLVVGGVGVVALGIARGLLPLIAVGAAGAALGAWNVAQVRALHGDTTARWRAHATGMMLSGVGAYSALAVVLANRFAPAFYEGPFGVVVWLFPATLGLPLIAAVRSRIT